MSSDILLTEIADGYAVVTMNRPEARNALSSALTRQIAETMAELDAREDVLAIILTGTDPAFTAGVDLKEISTSSTVETTALVAITDQRGPFPAMSTPVIGAVNGPAVTGGFEIALACDFLIASERARFADTHARVGIMPGWGLTVGLIESIGLRRARQLSFTGNYLDAHTALTWGLVNEVVPHEELLPRCRQLASDIASNDPRGVRHVRATYRMVADTTGDVAWQLEARRSEEWMRGFDPAEVAARRDAIQARGRAQAGS